MPIAGSAARNHCGIISSGIPDAVPAGRVDDRELSSPEVTDPPAALPGCCRDRGAFDMPMNRPRRFFSMHAQRKRLAENPSGFSGWTTAFGRGGMENIAALRRLSFTGFLAAFWAASAFAATSYTSFKPGQTWLADDGRHINCHGGGIYIENGTYYWFGESRSGRGVACYTSTDLYNWRNRGLVFTPDANIADIRPGCIMERPKVIKCPSTGKYTMWFHLEFAGEGYNTARVATCSSSTLLGPYTFVRSFRPSNNMSRDQNVFVDDDGTGYHIYSSRDNYDLRVHSLSADFLNTSGQDTMIFASGAHREAPALFKHNGTYYLITSAATGWAPNPARYDVSTYIWRQPWTRKTNPCVGAGADSTFGGQSTFVLRVPGYRDAYIFMADRWITSNLANSTHLWLPITILASGDIQITWRAEWDLSVFGPPVNVLREGDLRVARPVERGLRYDRYVDLLGREICAQFIGPESTFCGIAIHSSRITADRRNDLKPIFTIHDR